MVTIGFLKEGDEWEACDVMATHCSMTYPAVGRDDGMTFWVWE